MSSVVSFLLFLNLLLLLSKEVHNEDIPDFDISTEDKAIADTVIGSAINAKHKSNRGDGNQTDLGTKERSMSSVASSNGFDVDTKSGLDAVIINDSGVETRKTTRVKKGLAVDYELLLIIVIVFLPLGLAEYFRDKKLVSPLRVVPLPIPPQPSASRANELRTPPPKYEPPPPYSECRIDIDRVNENENQHSQLPTSDDQLRNVHWQKLKHMFQWMALARSASPEKQKVMVVAS